MKLTITPGQDQLCLEIMPLPGPGPLVVGQFDCEAPLVITIGDLLPAGVATAVVNGEGELVITMTNGEVINAGSVVGPAGNGTAATVSELSAAGTTQATATPVTANVNIVNGASDGTGVLLVASIPNAEILARMGQAIEVYPPPGEQIDGAGGVNASATIADGDNGTFVRLASATPVTWYFS